MEGPRRALDPPRKGVWGGQVCGKNMYCLQRQEAMPLIVVTVPFSPILGLTDPREVG